MAVDIITALPGGTCAIMHTKYCVFIPEVSAVVSSLLNHMRTQGNTLSDLAPSLRDYINEWFKSGALDHHYLHLCLLLHEPPLLPLPLPPVQPNSHPMSCLQANGSPGCVQGVLLQKRKRVTREKLMEVVMESDRPR